MKFYTQTHQHYCGIDLHARSLYVCIMDRDGTILAHKNINAGPEALLAIIAPYRDDLIIGVECMCLRWAMARRKFSEKSLS